MAGFLACSPLFYWQLTMDNCLLMAAFPANQLKVESSYSHLNFQLTHQWQQDLPGLQNLQLRVQLRTFTGFPFTNRQRKQIRLHHNPTTKVEKTDE